MLLSGAMTARMVVSCMSARRSRVSVICANASHSREKRQTANRDNYDEIKPEE